MSMLVNLTAIHLCGFFFLFNEKEFILAFRKLIEWDTNENFKVK